MATPTTSQAPRLTAMTSVKMSGAGAGAGAEQIHPPTGASTGTAAANFIGRPLPLGGRASLLQVTSPGRPVPLALAAQQHSYTQKNKNKSPVMSSPGGLAGPSSPGSPKGPPNPDARQLQSLANKRRARPVEDGRGGL